MSETIPEDIVRAVHHIVSEISDHADFGWDGQTSGESERAEASEIIARALLAERLSSTERAAKILTDYAERVELFSKDGHGGDTRWTWQGVRAQVQELAAAIRSQP